MAGGGGGSPVYIPNIAPGLGYGGAEYSYSSYGGAAYDRPPYPPGGGYGGAVFGLSSYGSADITPPRVSSAASVDGFHIEVFFSEEMKCDAVLLDAANYTVSATLGAPVTVLSVEAGVSGDHGGATSVIVTHSGTTLGGQYTVTVINATDLSDNRIDAQPTNTAGLLAHGEAPTYTVTPTAGDSIRLSFTQNLLTEAEFTPGVEQVAAYGTATEYPVPLTVLGVTHPVGGDASIVDLAVRGMTATSYALTVSPAEAISYDGTAELPSAASNFSGVEVGTGTSVVSSTGLRLSKAAGVSYGWDFQDTSGKVLPSSSFRVDVTYTTSVAVVSPPLYTPTFGTLIVSDGAVQVSIALSKVAGVYMADITSGGFSQTVPADWATGTTTLSLVRNQKAGHYSILVDGTPIVTAAIASFAGVPTVSAGARFILSPTYEVDDFVLISVGFTSTQTVFGSTWNFLHGVSSTFIGSSALARDHIRTERGPLVKGWGDATPATKQDVAVRVNGTAVAVAKVNPYQGKIYPEVPIPLMPVGDMTVDVDYSWFPNPVMEMAGLNTEGLVLNKWDQHKGHHYPPRPPGPGNGVPDQQRFPMGIVLGPMERRRPVLVGHRYIGFEKAYTASLNSPTTLLLNQDPHRIAKPDFERRPEAVSVLYEGEASPSASDPSWELVGSDSGAVVGDGTYRVVDASSGTYGEGDAAVYYRNEDTSFPATLQLVGRLLVEEYVADGVFSGVGFGAHDNFRLYMMGCLISNGVKHVGLLKNPRRPDLFESWEIGPALAITITSTHTFSVTGTLPSFLEAGSRIQIVSGTQAGVYTLAECGIEDTAEGVTVTVVEAFPADHTLFGNDAATAYVEVDWESASPQTYRIVADNDSKSAQLFVGGSLSGYAAELASVPAYPAETSLLLRTGDEGMLFWGSMSRLATSASVWSLYRYDITPDQTTFHSKDVVVSAEMSDPPEDDSNNPWYVTNEFGYAEVDASGDTLLLKSTSASNAVDLTYGYGRSEPFLTPTVAADIDATFRVDSGTHQDAQVVVRDGTREVVLSTLLYTEGGSPSYRSLLTLPSVSLSGLMTPENEGWSTDSTNSLTASVRQNVLTLDQALAESGTYFTDVPLGSATQGGRIIEARLAITSYTANASKEIGALFGASVGPAATPRTVAVSFLASPARVMLTSDGTPVATFAFDWSDGEFHSYRVVADPLTATATLTVDDTVLGTADLTLFDAAPDDTTVFVGAFGANVASTVEYDSFAVTVVPPTTAKRTLGVWLGGDKNDIDNWKVPRTDGSTAANSSSGAVVREMDWRSDTSVRIHRDPQWGVSIHRPDLAPPSSYTGDFATAITEPSAAWINVEYRKLPRQKTLFGMVLFGALDAQSVTQQRWGEVRYRIYQHETEDLISPHHMILNQWNVISSGEFNSDVTPEVVEVVSLSSTVVSLKPAHIYADRVFNVVVGGSLVSSSLWSFDKDAQAVFFSTPLSTDHVPVQVTFAPGKPVTNTYLQAQPLLDGVTKLNEGTPPFPKSQTRVSLRDVVFGSRINDPNDTLNSDPDFILNDPYRTVQFSDDPEALYDAMEFHEVQDSGETDLLSSICDGVAPEEGWIEIALEGPAFHDQTTAPGGPARWKGSPTFAGSATAFDQTKILHLSGGGYLGHTLSPDKNAILFPSGPAEGVLPHTDTGGHRELRTHLRMTSVLTSISPETTAALEDTYSFPTGADNTPPSSALGGDSVPDGTAAATGNGAVAGHMEDGAGLYSRVGPWGGLASLTPMSLLYGASASQPTGVPSSGVGMVLAGGAALPAPTQTALTIVAAN